MGEIDMTLPDTDSFLPMHSDGTQAEDYLPMVAPAPAPDYLQMEAPAPAPDYLQMEAPPPAPVPGEDYLQMDDQYLDMKWGDEYLSMTPPIHGKSDSLKKEQDQGTFEDEYTDMSTLGRSAGEQFSSINFG